MSIWGAALERNGDLPQRGAPHDVSEHDTTVSLVILAVAKKRCFINQVIDLLKVLRRKQWEVYGKGYC
jgi:hypothetical protein